MKFSISHERALLGNNLNVAVVREGEQVITEVETVLDKSRLALDHLERESVHYQRHFRQVGTSGPGYEHTLLVTASDQNRNSETATYKWVDER